MPTLNDLPEDWKSDIKQMYKDGAFDEEIIVWLDDRLGNFMLDNWQNWLNEEPEFRRVIETGRNHSLAYYLKQARDGMAESKFKSDLWTKIMTNCFNWFDSNTKVTMQEEIDYSNMSPDQLLKLLDDKMQPSKDKKNSK